MDVTAVIPAYNGETYIAETIEAILAQTHPPRAIIVVDDGSTDGTRRILDGFGARITVLSSANQGVQSARNLGVAHAPSDWIAFCDQDDLWQPGYLAAHARLVASFPQLDFVFGNFRMLRAGTLDTATKFDDAPPGYWDRIQRRQTPEGWIFGTRIASATYRFHPIFPSGVMVHKRLLASAGGFDPALRGLRNEDGEFIVRCLYTAIAGALPDAHVVIRRHASNFSRDLIARLQDEIVTMNFIKAHHEGAAPYHAIIDDEIRLKRIALAHTMFAMRDHARMREMFASLEWSDRTPKLWVKRLVAGLPAPLGIKLNTMLQRRLSGVVADENTFMR